LTLTPDFLAWRDRNTVFTSMVAFNTMTRTLRNAGDPVLHTAKASATLLSVLEVPPLLGRNFSRAEDRKGSDQVALLSYSLWRRNFGGDSRVLGRSITLDDRVYVVIGVMPPSFVFPTTGSIDIITPLAKNEDEEMKRGTEITVVHDVVARLKPGVSPEGARAELETLQSHLVPPAFMSSVRITVNVALLQTHVAGNLRGSLFALQGAVGFLLLMGCANLSNLLLSRTVNRQQEMAIRSSLGASRIRLIRQLFIESVILAMFACLVGLLLAFCTRGILLRLLPQGVPGLEELPLDWRVLSFTVLIAVFCAIVFGLAPALLSSAVPTSQALARQGWFVFLGARRQSVLNTLGSIQIAIAIVLLCGGGLMLQSFWNLRYRSVGFRTKHLLVSELHLSGAKYADTGARTLFVKRFLEYASSLPGVESVAVGNLPPGEGHATNGFGIEGGTQSREREKPTARSYAISPGYFRILQVPLLKGRDFSEQDGTGPLGVIVNETFVRRNLPGEDPLGKRLRLERAAPWSAIIGVVADVKTAGLLSPPESAIYFPYSRVGPRDSDDNVGILVRSAVNPVYIEPELRREIARLDLQQPIVAMQTMDQRLNESVAKPRLAAFLLGSFAALGLLLASLGLYGLISLLTRGKFREIGVRIALGARSFDIVRMVLMQSLRIIFVGILVGICCALPLTRLLQSLLYGVSASDPLIFSGVTGFLAFVALAASYFPARSASQIDPMATLRVE
jgi:putative ABC transport system permease protein